jgi:hypothetical protein
MKEQNCEERVVKIFGEEVEKRNIQNPVLRKILDNQRINSFLFKYWDHFDKHNDTYEVYADLGIGDY